MIDSLVDNIGKIIADLCGIVSLSPKTKNKKATIQRKIIACDVITQETDYTCTAACLQMLLQNKGIKLSHSLAIKRIGIVKDEGATIARMQTACRKHYKQLRLRKISEPECEIKKGNLVMAVTKVVAPKDHVVILKGYDQSHFWVADPIKRRPYKRLKREVRMYAHNEFYALVEI